VFSPFSSLTLNLILFPFIRLYSFRSLSQVSGVGPFPVWSICRRGVVASKNRLHQKEQLSDGKSTMATRCGVNPHVEADLVRQALFQRWVATFFLFVLLSFSYGWSSAQSGDWSLCNLYQGSYQG
jgi:hypothetical protein